VVADAKYGTKSPLLVGRHFLHANELVLMHPRTGMELRFESALPSELEAVLSALRS